MGKTADDIVGFNYPAGGGNDIGVYKQPQDNPNRKEVDTVYSNGSNLNDLNISVGNLTKGYRKDNMYGTGTMKGYGAATKGKKISGKMG